MSNINNQTEDLFALNTVEDLSNDSVATYNGSRVFFGSSNPDVLLFQGSQYRGRLLKMKRLLSLLLVETLTIGVFIFTPKAASAYCIYNKSDHDITALQLDIKPDSFKKVIKPNSHECCNWKDTSCTKNKDGQEGKTSFALYKGSFNTSAITASSILQKIASITANMIPVIGGAAKDATTEIFNSLDTYITKKAQLGVVTTYNGGVITYNGKEAFGCWQGPCKGNDINGDGSKGPKP